MTRNEQLHSFWYFLIAGIVFVLDRLTKNWALENCSVEPCRINDFLSFELLFNRGISWGMFHSTSDTTFMIVTFGIIGIIAVLGLYTFVRWNNTEWVIGETLVLAGSLSNIVDRFLYHGVVDFILLSAKGFSWPVFNIADACIVCGVCMMIVNTVWES